MSDEVISNEASNAQPVELAAPVSTGPTVEELQAQLDEAKRQSEGRLRDLQQERQKRQEYEARMSQSQAAPVAPSAQGEDEVEKLVTPYIKKHLEATYQQDKAWAFMESKTGKTRDQLQADPEFVGRFTNTINKYGVNKGNIYDSTVAAYELMELESLKSKATEKVRNANVVASQPLAGGNPPAPVSSKTFQADAFKSMPTAEFDKLSQTGSFKKVGDSFVYTPH